MVFKKSMVSFFAKDSGATNNNLVTPLIKSCFTLGSRFCLKMNLEHEQYHCVQKSL